MKNKESGVTLIVLVISIIVLLLIAGITINFFFIFPLTNLLYNQLPCSLQIHLQNYLYLRLK